MKDIIDVAVMAVKMTLSVIVGFLFIVSLGVVLRTMYNVFMFGWNLL